MLRDSEPVMIASIPPADRHQHLVHYVGWYANSTSRELQLVGRRPNMLWHVVGGHETSATTEVISPVREERAD